jgi:hypothetical protein
MRAGGVVAVALCAAWSGTAEAWEPTREYLHAACSTAEPWFYPRCLEEQIRDGLPKEQDKLRRDLLRVEVPTDCSGLDARTRGRYVEIREALARAKRVDDFRTNIQVELRGMLAAAGIEKWRGQEQWLRELGEFCAFYPVGLTADYVSGLLARGGELEQLIDRCPPPFAWTASCDGEVGTTTARYRSLEACEGGQSLGPGAVVETRAGRAELSLAQAGGGAVRLTLSSYSEIVLGESEHLDGRTSAIEVQLARGSIGLEVPAGVEATVRAGMGEDASGAYFGPGRAVLAYRPDGDRLTVTAESCRVVVAGGAGSGFVEPGMRLTFVDGVELPD